MTNKVKFWVPETKKIIEFIFEKEYNEFEVLEDIKSFYSEWLDPDEAGTDEEMLDEIETSTPESWIIDHMYDCCDYDIADVNEIVVDDKTANLLEWLETSITELRGYAESDDYDDLESHDCNVAAESYELVRDFVIGQF